ncbi:DUF4403 family protein [Sulfurimonas sp. SAG-AH-194-I05]|nr:DUF4403 family protein [Sulfurimonas sp. SAG-AH-194-I05]MDF1875446.1 DUF4403 family protein [Sulfurimonas sp. SAG-AH-194-I05]
MENHVTLKFLTLISSCTAIFFLNAQAKEVTNKPIFLVPSYVYEEKMSLIQMPITIDTKDIHKAILSKLSSPISQGSTKKLTAKLLTKSITKKELKNSFSDVELTSDSFKLWDKPTKALYNYTSSSVTAFLDKTFETGIWIKHKVYLSKLHISFQNDKVHIRTNYKITLSVDYEQIPFPSHETIKIKGLLDGVVYAQANVVGTISINNQAQLSLHIPQCETDLKFTKVVIPSAVEDVDFLKILRPELLLTKEILNKEVTKAIQNQISKKHLNVSLYDKIQGFVAQNAHAIDLKNNLWLLPHAQQISISQVKGSGTLDNKLILDVGVNAKPTFILSSTKPTTNIPKSIPITCEDFTPKLHLYPTLHIKYFLGEQKIKEALNQLLKDKNRHLEYLISKVVLYPSDTKLVIAITLKDLEKNTLSLFYLWGKPKLDTENMTLSLDKIDYTIESKSFLIRNIAWFLDEDIQELLEKETVFSYEKKFIQLSEKLKYIERKSANGVLIAKINALKAQNITITKDAFVIHLNAKGNASYKVSF